MSLAHTQILVPHDYKTLACVAGVERGRGRGNLGAPRALADGGTEDLLIEGA